MVSPITGPTTKVTTTDGGATLYKNQRVYKQAKPVDRPLPYNAFYALRTVALNSPSRTAQSVAFSDLTAISATLQNQLRSVAYDKLKSKISDRASIGAALAELPEAVQMVSNRLLQTRRLIKAVKRGRIEEAWAVVSETYGRSVAQAYRKRTTRRRGDDWASRYLEMHFGWTPMIGDIYDSIAVLQEPIKDVRVKATATSALSTWRTVSGVPSLDYQTFDYSKGQAARYGCEVAISNPNLWLANQLGLVNPLSVAWEVVPFSFVVDWFVNVEQFLTLGTDFLGLTLKNSYSTDAAFGTEDYVYTYAPTKVRRYARFTAGRTSRSTGLILPSLSLKPAKLWGWKRAASAAALLTLLLPGKR